MSDKNITLKRYNGSSYDTLYPETTIEQVTNLQDSLNSKQATLVSGTNIKTINSSSLLGSGNIDVNALPSQTGQSGKYLTTDGTDASWSTLPTDNFVRYEKTELMNLKAGIAEWPLSNQNSCICFGNNKLVAINPIAAEGAYSTDGINWTTYTLSETFGSGALCYGNSEFIFIKSDGTTSWYSTDGISWTSRTVTNLDISSISWQSVCYGNGKYVIVTYCTSKSGAKYAYSTDGTTWTVGTSSLAYSGDTSHCVCYGGSTFIMVNQSRGFAYYSTDGVNWTQYNLNHSSYSVYANYTKPCYGSGKFVIASSTQGSGGIEYSTDGTSWTEVVITSFYPNYIVYGDGKFIAMNSSGEIYYSTDGVAWTSGGHMLRYSTCTWINLYYCENFGAIRSDAQYLTYSDNGIDWSATMPSHRNWGDVCFGNGKFVAISMYTAGTISINACAAYSTDGIYWTESVLPDATKNWCSICYGNNKFVTIASDYSGIGAYSTDGITWTSMSIPTISSTAKWTSVCYGSDKFVAVSSNYSSAYSTDGITWTQTTTPLYMSDAVCYGNGKFVAAGYSSESNGLQYSEDGISWSLSTSPSSKLTDNSNWGICYGNGKFVATSSNYSGQSVVAYSTDGMTWNSTTISQSDVNRVCYGNGKFVAFSGAAGTNIYYSLDAINWTAASCATASYIYTLNGAYGNICYGNKLFVIIAPSNRVGGVNRSTNGIDWRADIGIKTGTKYTLKDSDGEIITEITKTV